MARGFRQTGGSHAHRRRACSFNVPSRNSPRSSVIHRPTDSDQVGQHPLYREPGLRFLCTSSRRVRIVAVGRTPGQRRLYRSIPRYSVRQLYAIGPLISSVPASGISGSSCPRPRQWLSLHVAPTRSSAITGCLCPSLFSVRLGNRGTCDACPIDHALQQSPRRPIPIHAERSIASAFKSRDIAREKIHFQRFDHANRFHRAGHKYALNRPPTRPLFLYQFLRAFQKIARRSQSASPANGLCDP